MGILAKQTSKPVASSHTRTVPSSDAETTYLRETATAARVCAFARWCVCARCARVHKRSRVRGMRTAPVRVNACAQGPAGTIAGMAAAGPGGSARERESVRG